ncbi:hypothetical protein GPECTOR_42phG14 [Gonium pectorale]|uniref:Pherophorin domain-containing protein n=1 Tax=Gonium pectorale TaxID=33097 RepID=A0A150G9X0_GONPE|nr:hypothetical protein GPECTOR_42phG14 [Gonium pectorale]|eukprot:KXZ46646.1 hypothetical protein GPECTOR_42phG14 [Gonium pectorale]
MPYTFNTTLCALIANLISANMSAEAARVGAMITTPFSLANCSSAYNGSVVPPVYPFVQVCGSFRSPADGIMLQPYVNSRAGLQGWVEVITGGPVCFPELGGYTVNSTITDQNGAFNTTLCAAVANEITSDMNAEAALKNSIITSPFALRNCSSAYNGSVVPPVYPFVQVCGSFLTPADGVMLTPFVESPDGLQSWVAIVTGGNVCYSGLDGYTVTSMVADENGAPSPCLQGTFFQECIDNFPGIPSPPAAPPASPLIPNVKRPPPPKRPPPRPPTFPGGNQPSPPPICEVFVYVYVIPNTASPPGGTFGFNQTTCGQLAGLITESIWTNATALGSNVISNFSLATCDRTYILLKGAFLTAEDGQKLQAWLNGPTGLQAWIFAFVGGSTCPNSLFGYTFFSIVTGPSGLDTCLYGDYKLECNAPPPPPPSPPPPFPSPRPPSPKSPYLVLTHDCVSSLANVPYVAGPLVLSTTVDQQGSPAVAMCTNITAQRCRRTAFCCNMTYSKIEVPISNSCRPDLRILSINGLQRPFSWGLYDNDLVTVKFDSLPAPPTGEMCWIVRPGPCADPVNFCLSGQCQASTMVSIYSDDNKCCPGAYIS